MTRIRSIKSVDRELNRKAIKSLSKRLQEESPFDRKTINISDLPEDIEFLFHPDTGVIQHAYLGEDYHASHERNYEGPDHMDIDMYL